MAKKRNVSLFTLYLLLPKEITKEQLDAAMAKYPPSKYIIWGYKFFSTAPLNKNFKEKSIFFYLLLVFFFIGFFGTIFNASHKLIATVTIGYFALLLLLTMFSLSVFILNVIRIKKICNELKISIKEYDKLIEKYYEN